MKFGDKLKDLRKQAQDAVAENREKIHDAVDVVSTTVDQKTGGKHTAKIAKFGEQADAAVDRFSESDDQPGSEPRAADGSAPSRRRALRRHAAGVRRVARRRGQLSRRVRLPSFPLVRHRLTGGDDLLLDDDLGPSDARIVAAEVRQPPVSMVIPSPRCDHPHRPLGRGFGAPRTEPRPGAERGQPAMTDMAADAAEAEVPQTAQAGRYDAFLSYAREDRKFVEQLRADLIAAGLEVWVDVEDIPGGARWRERVTRGIEACKAFVFVISPDSVASAPCQEELSLAGSFNKLVVPVVRRTVSDELPPELSEFEWIFIGEDVDPDVETRNREIGTRKLVEALQTDLAWRDAHTRLAGRAREWIDGDRDGSYLLRGADLRAAEAWLAQQEGHREQPTAAQTEYVARSRQAAGRRLRALLGGLGIALAVAITLAVVALVQRNSAVHNQHVAESRALTAESSQQLSSDAELATLLALRAVRIDSTSSAVLALRQAVGADQLTRVLPNPPATVRFDPADASILATAASDGTIDIWNGQTRKADRQLSEGRAGEHRPRRPRVWSDR